MKREDIKTISVSNGKTYINGVIEVKEGTFIDFSDIDVPAVLGISVNEDIRMKDVGPGQKQ